MTSKFCISRVRFDDKARVIEVVCGETTYHLHLIRTTYYSLVRFVAAFQVEHAQECPGTLITEELQRLTNSLSAPEEHQVRDKHGRISSFRTFHRYWTVRFHNRYRGRSQRPREYVKLRVGGDPVSSTSSQALLSRVFRNQGSLPSNSLFWIGDLRTTRILLDNAEDSDRCLDAEQAPGSASLPELEVAFYGAHSIPVGTPVVVEVWSVRPSGGWVGVGESSRSAPVEDLEALRIRLRRSDSVYMADGLRCLFLRHPQLERVLQRDIYSVPIPGSVLRVTSSGDSTTFGMRVSTPTLESYRSAIEAGPSCDDPIAAFRMRDSNRFAGRVRCFSEFLSRVLKARSGQGKAQGACAAIEDGWREWTRPFIIDGDAEPYLCLAEVVSELGEEVKSAFCLLLLDAAEDRRKCSGGTVGGQALLIAHEFAVDGRTRQSLISILLHWLMCDDWEEIEVGAHGLGALADHLSPEAKRSVRRRCEWLLGPGKDLRLAPPIMEDIQSCLKRVTLDP